MRKSLSADLRQQAADGFGAEGQFLSAGKKLLDTRHAKYKAVTAVRDRVGGYWKSLSLPYPEPGLRLIRQADVEPFAAQGGLFGPRDAGAALQRPRLRPVAAPRTSATAPADADTEEGRHPREQTEHRRCWSSR